MSYLRSDDIYLVVSPNNYSLSIQSTSESLVAAYNIAKHQVSLTSREGAYHRATLNDFWHEFVAIYLPNVVWIHLVINGETNSSKNKLCIAGSNSFSFEQSLFNVSDYACNVKSGKGKQYVDLAPTYMRGEIGGQAS